MPVTKAMTLWAKTVLPAAEWERVERYFALPRRRDHQAFGVTRDGLAVAYALGYWMHRFYFRVQSQGHHHVPRTGAAVVVGNHSGVLPFDGMMIATDLFRSLEHPRLVRYMVDYFVYAMPFVGMFFRSLGQIPGTRHNFDALVQHGHLVGVFPEGAAALGKPVSSRYELLPFTPGHVELAARHRVPIVPFGLVGAEEQQTMLTSFDPLARLLRLPFFPITTTFPWFGPLGLLPRPVTYFIRYGAPLDIDPEAARRREIQDREVERVREAVGLLIHEALHDRRPLASGSPSSSSRMPSLP